MTQTERRVTVGVLALQGAFSEHIQLLRKSFAALPDNGSIIWSTTEVRTVEELEACDALIIPGGESTTIALVAARSGMLEPLRSFVKIERKPVWGTCAGMILLAEAANRTKKGGQELVGGLDVRVNRNYFGRQVESFEQNLHMSFLGKDAGDDINRPFRAVFIRAPVVERTLLAKEGVQDGEEQQADTVIAPSRTPNAAAPTAAIGAKVEILATLPGKNRVAKLGSNLEAAPEDDIVAVRQGNVIATSFHPELTDDPRIHVWWLKQVLEAIPQSQR